MVETSPVPIRVLQYTYGGASVSGIDTYLAEVSLGIDQSMVQYDLLYRYGSPFDEEALRDRFPNSKVYELCVPEQGNPLLRQLSELRGIWRFFSRHRYDIVEINMTSTFMCIQAAIIARHFGAKSRIMHSHVSAFSESKAKRLLKSMFTPMLVRLSTEHWACAEDAARYLYGEKLVDESRWLWVKNPVNVDRFVYDPVARESKRDELGLGDEPAVCIVGRLSPEKNHLFGLQVFREILVTKPSARLFIVGGGALREQLEVQVRGLGLDASVEFLGQRNDLDKLYSAFDLLLAPSLNEGFPVTSLEAQASGLPGLVSPAYPEASRISPQVQMVPLTATPEQWAEKAIELLGGPRQSYAEAIKDAGFTAAATGSQLQQEYLRISDEIAGRKVGL